MSSEENSVRETAERIARRLAADDEEADATLLKGESSRDDVQREVARLRRDLTEIYHRLDKLEAHLGHHELHPNIDHAAKGPHQRATEPEMHKQNFSNQESQSSGTVIHGMTMRSPWLSSVYVSAAHPSSEKFGIDEAVSELVDYFERERVCELEPGGRPCDHCAMCSARGF